MRRIFFALMLGIALELGGFAGFCGAVYANESTDKQATLTKIEQNLNEIKTLQAKFVQMTNGRQDLRGNLMVKRPNRMKLTYDNADPLLIADGYDLMFYEPSLDQLTYIGLDASPAFMILREHFSFNDPRVQIIDYKDNGRQVWVSLQMSDDPLAGKIMMVFDRESLVIKGWIMQDAEGNRTVIKMTSLKINDPVKDSVFEFHRPGADKYY